MDKSIKGFSTPAQFTGYTRKADRSISLRFVTAREYTPDEVKKVDEYFQKEGYLLFKPNRIQVDDIPKEDLETEGKTKSQRLRAVLYVFAKEGLGLSDEEAAAFYHKEMEKIIDHYKKKLE